MTTTAYPLLTNFFQLAYVTTDLEQAMAVLGDRFGVKHFRVMPDLANNGMTVHIALAYAGELMLEIIQPDGGDDSFYRDPLPAAGFALRHHHNGYRVDDVSQWQRLEASIAAGRHPVAMAGEVPELLRYSYVDARQTLGHYLEYICTTAAGEAAFFGDVPRN